MRGIPLDTCTWQAAERTLSSSSIVVLPLGAQLKEHGPHLPLSTDWIVAEWFRARVLDATDVVMLPTLAWHFFPAFVDYPGSVTLAFDTARNLTMDICASIARFGPKRFYIINTGVSTRRPLAAVSEMLAMQGVLMRYTDIEKAGDDVVRSLSQQEFGTHADEIETSMMLAIAPERVDMSHACADGHAGSGQLRRDASLPGVYSPSGIVGDARLASRDKGERVLAAMLRDILADIEALRTAPLQNRTNDAQETGTG